MIDRKEMCIVIIVGISWCTILGWKGVQSHHPEDPYLEFEDFTDVCQFFGVSFFMTKMLRGWIWL